MGNEIVENKTQAIWEFAQNVDPACTKDNDTGGYKATSINGYWFIKMATALWGPCGVGWGYDILEERYDEGAPIIDKESGIPICKTLTHTIKLSFWYMNNGEKVSVIQFGHTPFLYGAKYGPITDHEAPKKSLMDSIKKCLSMLGFAADVYLGEWDDPAYAAMRHAEKDIDGADDKEDRLQQELTKIVAKCDDYFGLMGSSQSLSELDKIHKNGVRYFTNLRKSVSPDIKETASTQLNRLVKGYEKRTAQLKEKTNETV